MNGGRLGSVALAALVVLAAGACGGGPRATVRRPPRTEPPVADRPYHPGDCVMWGAHGGSVGPTRLVDCEQPHRIQLTARVTGPPHAAYPSEAQWDALTASACAAPAAKLLGMPLDPSGRFALSSIRATAEGWAQGDTVMWCGLVRRSDDPHATLVEDARGADQAFHFRPGVCVARPPSEGVPRIVPCDRPHLWEVTGEVTYPDGPAPPTVGEDPGCYDATVRFLGGPPVEPWAAGLEKIPAASWAAGKRTATCFVAQWNADGTPAAVRGSALAPP